jgi:hypothetical protein
MNKNILFYTSFIFISNILLALYYKYYVYAFLFTMLMITSFIIHSSYNIYTNIIDKISILCIVIYGVIMFYNKIQYSETNNIYILIIITTFLLCIHLYYYGYITNQYCFDSNKNIGDKYHSLLHLLASVGHHSIILL